MPKDDSVVHSSLWGEADPSRSVAFLEFVEEFVAGWVVRQFELEAHFEKDGDGIGKDHDAKEGENSFGPKGRSGHGVAGQKKVRKQKANSARSDQADKNDQGPGVEVETQLGAAVSWIGWDDVEKNLPDGHEGSAKPGKNNHSVPESVVAAVEGSLTQADQDPGRAEGRQHHENSLENTEWAGHFLV